MVFHLKPQLTTPRLRVGSKRVQPYSVQSPTESQVSLKWVSKFRQWQNCWTSVSSTLSTTRLLTSLRISFVQVDDSLANGQPYICGSSFTAADLTFASLAGPMILPPGYDMTPTESHKTPKRLSEQSFRQQMTYFNCLCNWGTIDVLS